MVDSAGLTYLGYLLNQFFNLNGHIFWCFALSPMKPSSNKFLLRIDLNLNSLDRIIISFKPKPSADLFYC